MNVNNRIKLVREKFYNGSAKNFAKDLSVSSQAVSNYVRDGYNVGREVLENILNIIPNLNANWLLTGEGEMLKEDSAKEDDRPSEYLYSLKNFIDDYYSYISEKKIRKELLEKQLRSLTEEEIQEIAKILEVRYDDLTIGVDIVSKSPKTGKLVPVYNAAAAAENGTIELPTTREGWVNVGDLLKDSEGSLYVYGNSMIPGYPPGSLVGFRTLNESFIEPGSVYVVQTESNRYIKRLYYNEDKTALLCISDNHIKHLDGPLEGQYFYPPFEIPLSAVKVIYKVTGVIKRNSMTYM